MWKLRIKKLILWGVVFCIGSGISWGDIIISDALGNQTRPQVVWGEGKYLVVWDDYRNGQGDIYAQFVDSSGNLIDTNFKLIPGLYEKHICDISASDSNYFVLFVDSFYYSKLYGAIVSLQGTLIGTPFLIGDSVLYAFACVAWNGEKNLVAWNHAGEGWSFLSIGKFLSINGTPLSDTFIITSFKDSMLIFDLASNNEDFLLLFLDYHYPSAGILGPTQGMIIHSTGSPLDTLFSIPYSWGQMSVASSSGDNYLVVHCDGNNGWGPVYGQMVSSDGRIIGSWFPVSDSQHIGVGDVASNGANYLVILFTDCFTSLGHIVGQFVSPNGELIGTDFLVTPIEFDGLSSSLACAGNASNYLVVWGIDDSFPSIVEDWNIYGNLVPSVGVEESKTLFPFRLRNFPNPCHQNPRISFELNERSNVSFSVWNIAGELVEKKDLGYKMPGIHIIFLDKRLSSGIYFYTLKINEYAITQKMVVLH